MHQELGRPSFAEAVVSETLGHNQRLERIDDAVDWERLAQVVAGVHAAPRGRPSYPPRLMVKVLLLQQWYSLSDPQMEEALGDRLSFRRFVGLGLADDTPDHSTISRFRAAVDAQGLSARLFEVLAAQLDAQGLVVKQGTLLDATLVAGPGAAPAAGGGARGAEPHRSRGGVDPAGRPLPFRLQGASGGGRGHGGGATGRVDPRQRRRERRGRHLGERR